MHIPRRRLRSETRIAAVVVFLALLLHGVRLATWFDWTDMVDNPPLHYRDYATHFATTESTAHFLSEGHLWGYDPYFHAGHPSGVLFNADNRAIEIVSILLSRVGLSLPLAFNAVTASLLILSPFALALAVGLLGMNRVAGAAGFAIGIVSWYSDPTVNWTWRGGTLAFGATSLIGLAVVAAFLRWAGFRLRPDGSDHAAHRATHGVALWIFFVVGPSLFWLHPWAFFILLPPVALGTLLHWSRWSSAQRVLLVLWVFLVLAANWPWLHLVWEWLPAKTPSDQYLQGGIQQLGLEAKNPAYLLRWNVFVIAAVACRRMRRGATDSERSLATVVGGSFLAWIGLAYAGTYVGLEDVQPHRFIIPAALLASLVSGLVVTPVSPSVVVGPQVSHRWRLWLVTLLLLASPALYFSRARGRVGADGVPRDDLGGPMASEWEVASTLRAQNLEEGRVLTNDWRLGSLLPYAAGAQMIGGPFPHVWTTHGHTNANEEALLGKPIAEYTRALMFEALDTYNIRWIVVNTKMSPETYGLPEWIEDHSDLFGLLSEHGVFRIYANKTLSGWVRVGTARVMAGHNRLRIEGATGDTLILKYHWIPSLEIRTDDFHMDAMRVDGARTNAARTSPARADTTRVDAMLFPVPISGDPEPFIGVVTGGETDFEIVQNYAFP